MNNNRNIASFTMFQAQKECFPCIISLILTITQWFRHMSPHFTDKETEDIKARDGSRLLAVTKGKQAMNTGHLNSELCHFNLYATPAPCFNICPFKNPILLHITGNQVSFVSFSTAFLYSNFKTLFFLHFYLPCSFPSPPFKSLLALWGW